MLCIKSKMFVKWQCNIINYYGILLKITCIYQVGQQLYSTLPKKK